MISSNWTVPHRSRPPIGAFPPPGGGGCAPDARLRGAFHKREAAHSPRRQPCGPWWPSPRRRCALGAAGRGCRGREDVRGGLPAARRGRRPGAPTPAPPSGSRGLATSAAAHAGRRERGQAPRDLPPPGNEGSARRLLQTLNGQRRVGGDWLPPPPGSAARSTRPRSDFEVPPGACATALGRRQQPTPARVTTPGNGCQRRRATTLSGPGGANGG